jgi:hypothetical protein
MSVTLGDIYKVVVNELSSQSMCCRENLMLKILNGNDIEVSYIDLPSFCSVHTSVTEADWCAQMEQNSLNVYNAVEANKNVRIPLAWLSACVNNIERWFPGRKDTFISRMAELCYDKDIVLQN